MTYPERIVPEETSPGILALHLKRYEFALPWSESADVLDAGCGVGYGAAFLVPHARRVVAVDRSKEALDHARAHYASPKIEFVEGDLSSLPLPAGSFDVVCAFEAIEHLDEPALFLAEAARVLRPDGTLIVSTPRVDRTTHRPENPFHRVELSAGDFERVLRERFEAVTLYGQRRLQTRRHRLVQRLDVLGLRRLGFMRPASRLLGTPPTTEVGLDGIVISQEGLDRASELIAVCTGARG